MYKRNIKTSILNSLKNYPVTLVCGARQIGKSTLCYEIARELGFDYVSLDDLNVRKEAINDPIFFLSKYDKTLIIDEIQYAPILFEVIESIVNKKRLEIHNPNGLYLLTGSQSFHLMKGVSQSLAGRVNVLKMNPLSYQEINNLKFKPLSYNVGEYLKCTNNDNINNIFRMIVKGFYPELHKNISLNPTQFYSMYVETYINRDVSEFLNIKNKLKFHRFMQYIASLTGCELNKDNISMTLEISKNTVNEWLSVLEASNIIYFLQPYNDTSIKKRIVKSPKLYFNDTGLACYLAKFNDSNTLMNSYFSGAFFETFVMNEIKKGFDNNERMIEELYYYRDSNQNEIDLVILENANLHLIEIKSGMMFDKKHVKSFSQLYSSQYKIGTSYIVCMSDNVYKIDDNIYTLPIFFI